MPSPPVTCSDCGSKNVDEIGTPCPECGSTRRNRSLHAEIGAYSITPNDVQLIVTEYHRVLFNFASELFNQKRQYGITIVVAHMACEMATESVVAKFTNGAPQNANMYGYSLGSDNNLRKYVALTGDKIQQQISFWQKFKESADRRNNIMHNRHIATQNQAEESLRATNMFITYLEQKFGIS